MDPALQAALAANAPVMVGAVEILLPGYPLRLLDGSGELAINGHLYVGEDPAFGALDSISAMGGGGTDEAPEIDIDIYPPDATAAATLANAAMQGAAVSVIIGAFDPVAGSMIGIPEVLFYGEVDVPTLEIGENGQRTLTLTCVSAWERLFDVDEGVRAADGWHQSIWPGERGLEYMTGTDKNLYWGQKSPSRITQALAATPSQAYLNLTGGR